MNKKKTKVNIDPIKMIFWIVACFIAVVIFVGSSNFNQEMDRYKNLYKGITIFDEVEKKHAINARQLTDNYTYMYEGNEIDVNLYSLSGDSEIGKGIRYFDKDMKYQKDNDIVNLIPKDYFFTFIPEGKIVYGKGYGYYIRTVKDLSEEQPGYNSTDYFKSVVMLFSCPLDTYNLNGETFGTVMFNVISVYEYHSYQKVSKNFDKELPADIKNDIIENGVVTYYKDIDGTDNFIMTLNNITLSLEYESIHLGYKLSENGVLKDSIKTNQYSTDFVIVTEGVSESKYMKYNTVVSIDIRDGLWIDVTWLSEICYEDKLLKSGEQKKELSIK